MNDVISNAPDVVVERAQGSPAWRCTQVHHMTGEENQGRHNVFIDCILNGQAVRDGKLQIEWGWEGQRSDEASPPKVCDKRAPDHCTDIPIERDIAGLVSGRRSSVGYGAQLARRYGWHERKFLASSQLGSHL